MVINYDHSTVLIPAISWGDSTPQNSKFFPQKNTQNTQKLKKCIKFTPQICVPPRTRSLELTPITQQDLDIMSLNTLSINDV